LDKNEPITSTWVKTKKQNGGSSVLCKYCVLRGCHRKQSKSQLFHISRQKISLSCLNKP